MKKIISLVFSACVCIALAAGPSYAAEATVNILPNGGFERTFRRDGKLLPGHWGVRLEPDARGVSWRIDSENKKEGDNSLRVDTTAEKSLAVVVHSGARVEVGEIYKVSAWVRNTGAHFSVRQDLILSTGRFVTERFKILFQSNTSHDWRRFEGIVKIEEGEERLGLTMFLGRKPGTVWIDDVRIEKVVEKGVEFRLTPNYYIDDNVFHLPENAPMLVQLTVKNAGGHEPKSPRFILDLPEGIEMLGSDYDSLQAAKPTPIRKNGQAYVRYDYYMGLPRLVLRNLDFSRTAFNSTVVLLRTNRSAGPEVFDAWITFVDGPVKGRPSLFRLKVVPALKRAQIPKRFRTMADTSPTVEFMGEALSAWADFYVKSGFNEIIIPSSLRAFPERAKSRCPSFIIKEMKARGLTVTIHQWAFVNGFRLRNAIANRAPDSVRIKRADGSITPYTFDPAYIYRGGEWFVRAMNALLDSTLAKGADHLWVNWEPWMFRMERGSFTERSLRDFAKFTGRDYEDVLAMNPMDIVRQYPQELMKFQSWQFAKVMKTINDIVRAKSRQVGRRIDFIPCVASMLLSDIHQGMQHEEFARCFSGVEWLPYVDIVSGWKYVSVDHKKFVDPRIRTLWDLGARRFELGPMDHRATHVHTLLTVEKHIDFIARTLHKAGREPIPYLHLIQAAQVDSWIVKPRAIGLQMLATFIGGADGVSLYFFPRGYDGRYWRSAAAANDLIARYEDFVLDGKRVSDDFKMKPITALHQHQDFQQNLTLRAFEYQGRTLIALCNFDFLGDAVFKLRFPNVVPGNYVLHMPHREEVFTLNGSVTLNEQALREITLALPPMTIEFMVLEPYVPGRVYGRAIDLAASATIALQRVPELDSAFKARWKALQEAMHPPVAKIEKFERPKVAPIRQGNIVGEFVEINGDIRYRAVVGDNEVLIDPTTGAIVRSWKYGGTQLVQEVKGAEGLARDRFYHPAGSMDLPELVGPYRFVSHRATADTLEVTFERSLQHGPLAGIVIRKTFVVGNNGFEVRYRITNTGSEGLSVGFWTKNMLAALDNSINAKPILRFGAQEIDDFQGRISFFRVKGADVSKGYQAILRRFVGLDGQEVMVPTSTVYVQGISPTVRVSVEGDILYGYYMWGSASSRIMTLEAVFKPRWLGPMETMDVSIRYTAVS